MRTDKNLASEVREQPSWQATTNVGGAEDPINQSFSGEERNRWYQNQSRHDPSNPTGRDLLDQSILSGLDSISDGRAFAIGDFNRDGRPDIAICNANAPLLQLFENQIETDNNFIAVRFEGAAGQEGNSRQKSGRETGSSRDGYGAVVKLTLDNGQTILREFRCGEGFAAQNSDTLLIGIGDAKIVTQVEVSWPAGSKSRIGPVPSGRLVLLSELNADQESKMVPYSIAQ